MQYSHRQNQRQSQSQSQSQSQRHHYSHGSSLLVTYILTIMATIDEYVSISLLGLTLAMLWLELPSIR